MTFSIKICGLKTPETVARAVDLGASHIGFIFFPKSPRNIEPADAAKLADIARDRAKVVAVTVNAENDDLDEIVALLKPDILQLHGNESPDRVLNVKAVYGLPVMKAFSISTSEDLKKLGAYECIADRFLLDAKAPAGSTLPGGNGIAFDWGLLDALDENLDYMLSGGLNKDNVADAIKLTRCTGIDVSSGVESAPGVKDIAKIEAFFEAAQTAIAAARI
ncbi:phosphoribosylanthranilate isomerase [Rhizobium sp. L1K21]|uniref:phosphoribosylanthranilate isomerase n=1 Tax=Rhizobium sp. L1K21 TaxID=2954933 RepID=UPI0020935B38|nr:phosphoribosylanthranilate isomerase [Rhizobium sp. L1K21]MCO6187990.1 phosphoribosylanthranilate isomerase [Rhizobium sp. L1K21]